MQSIPRLGFHTLGVCIVCEVCLVKVIDAGQGCVSPMGSCDAIVGRSPLILNTSSDSPPSTAYSLPNGHFIANVDGCPLYGDIDPKSHCYRVSMILSTLTKNTR